MDYVIGKNPCKRCKSRGRDRSNNNFHWYGDGLGGTCFSCGYTIPSDDHKKQNRSHRKDLEEDYIEEIEEVGSEFNKEIHKKIKEITGIDPRGYRGIREDISKQFGVRYQYSEEDGSVTKSMYPTTIDYDIAGYKVRIDPKDFSKPVGETGKNCELFGQFKFKTFNHTVLCVGGEVDMLSAFQMLSDAQRNKQYDPCAVVSPTVGETGAFKQVKEQYQFFNQFKKIIVCMDNDEAGREATEKLVKVLPRGKVFVMEMRYKDPNEYLTKGKEQEFISDFWGAKQYTPAGLHASKTFLDAACRYADVKQLSLPSFMRKAQEMFNGSGLVKNEITTIFAQTSVGKSAFTDAMVVHWVLNEPEEVIGVLSLEATVDKYATNILSNYLGVRLNKMSGEDRKAYLRSEAVTNKVNKLLTREDGSSRFYALDERGAGIEVIKEKIVEMIVHMGVTVVVVDVASDLFDGLALDEQESTIAWFKKLNKEYPDITLIFVAHTRKIKAGERITESDIMGSSTLMKSSGQTISLERNKLHENPHMRNVTEVTIHKNRHFGETGPAGQVYFDLSTSKLFDLDDFIESHPEMESAFYGECEQLEDKPLNQFGYGERK